MASKHMKIWPPSDVIRKMQTKTTRYHYTPITMAKSSALTAPNAGEGVEQQELSSTAGGNANGAATLEDSWVVSHKTKYTFTVHFSNHTSWYLPKLVENLCPHKKLYIAVYSTFIMIAQT